MNFLRNLFGKESSQIDKEQQQRIQKLIGRMDKDIKNGGAQELGGTRFC